MLKDKGFMRRLEISLNPLGWFQIIVWSLPAPRDFSNDKRPNDKRRDDTMKDIDNITPIEMVTQTEHIKSLLKEYHQNLVANTNRKQFEGMLKEIVTPTLTGLYGNTTQGLAVRSIQTYVEDLIPKVKTPKMRKLVDNAGLPMLDKYGKQQEQYEIGPDGKVVMVDVPMF